MPYNLDDEHLCGVCPSCRTRNSSCIGRLPQYMHFCDTRLDAPRSGGALVECMGCGLWYKSPTPSQSELNALYAQQPSSTWSTTERVRRDQADVVAFLAKQLPPSQSTRSILDIGCSTGQLLKEIQQKLGANFHLYGIEPSIDAQDSARQHGINVIGSSYEELDGLDPTLVFDVITVIDVFEHLVDPDRFMALLSKKLGRDGLIVLISGATDSEAFSKLKHNFTYASMPEHIIFFNKKYLSGLSKKHNLHLAHYSLHSYISRESTGKRITKNLFAKLMNASSQLRSIAKTNYRLIRLQTRACIPPSNQTDSAFVALRQCPEKIREY